MSDPIATFASHLWLLLLVSLVTSVHAQTQISQANIGTAVSSFITNPTTAIQTYGPIETWDTSRVTDMTNLFLSRPSFNANITLWNTASVTSFASMFQGATSFNQNVGRWNTAKVTTLASMFSSGVITAGAFVVGTAYTIVSLGSTDFKTIGAYDNSVEQAFYATGVGSGTGTASPNMLFNQNLGGWNTGAVTDMSSVFSRALYFNQNIGGWDTSKVNTLASVFFWRAQFQPQRWWLGHKRSDHAGKQLCIICNG